MGCRKRTLSAWEGPALSSSAATLCLALCDLSVRGWLLSGRVLESVVEGVLRGRL